MDLEKSKDNIVVCTHYSSVLWKRFQKKSLLVDWMVAVQESFELNHETLYSVVQLVDLYLTDVLVGKETLQLLEVASLFIASKFDERIPLMVDDFLYICDGAYTQRELLRVKNCFGHANRTELPVSPSTVTDYDTEIRTTPKLPKS